MPLLPKNSYNQQFIASIRDTIIVHKMLAPNDRVLIAVSGGMDSVTLFHALSTLSTEQGWILGIYHLNHGLRCKESERDAEFTARLSETFSVQFHLESVDVRKFKKRRKLSLEEAARLLRYQGMQKIATEYGYHKIALGHHADDNAELILMNFIRGSGPLGLSGIPPVRDKKIIRPLIGMHRADIEKFVQINGLPFVYDSSNSDLHFYRNKIRHILLPFLEKEFNPNLPTTLNRISEIIALEDKCLEELVTSSFVTIASRREEGRVELNLKKLMKEHTAIRRRILRRAIKIAKGDLRRITLGHINDLIKLADSKTPGKQIHLPDGIVVIRQADSVLISKKTSLPTQEAYTSPISLQIQKAQLNSGSIPIGPTDKTITFSDIFNIRLPDFSETGQDTAFFDMDKIRFPLEIRRITEGDRFQPLGMTGTQKIKKFLINEMIPKNKRGEILVLLNAGYIIWIMGYRVADQAKVGPNTNHILKVQIALPNQLK